VQWHNNNNINNNNNNNNINNNGNNNGNNNINNNNGNNNNGFVANPNNNVARAVGDDADLFNDDFSAAAFSDDEVAFAYDDSETAFLDETLSFALDEEIAAAAAFAEDDADSSDFALFEESGDFSDSTFNHDSLPVEETGSFALIEESGDFAAIEEEAAAFALEENLESFVGASDNNLQSFNEDPFVAAAVGEEDLPLAEEGELPGDLAVAEEDIAAAFADNIDVENLVLDTDEAAFAFASDVNTLPKSDATALPSWGIALIVIGAFIAIACILVVLQLFIYFRSA